MVIRLQVINIAVAAAAVVTINRPAKISTVIKIVTEVAVAAAVKIKIKVLKVAAAVVIQVVGSYFILVAPYVLT